MKDWPNRPSEHRTLFNPAFLAVLIADIAAGYEDESKQPLPYVLPFLSVPIVIHEPTRESLPTIATSMYAWLDRRPQARVEIPLLAPQFVESIREAIRFGALHDALKFGAGGSIVPLDLSKPRRGSQTPELRRCRDRARFTGRWLGRAGDPGTILVAWGLRV